MSANLLNQERLKRYVKFSFLLFSSELKKFTISGLSRGSLVSSVLIRKHTFSSHHTLGSKSPSPVFLSHLLSLCLNLPWLEQLNSPVEHFHYSHLKQGGVNKPFV